MKHILREITPPFLWRAISKVRARKKTGFKYGVEQPSEFYDYTYTQSEHWNRHYTESHYYPVWTVIGDRIRCARPKRILDIGCGPGQVACLLRDIEMPEYIGLDFSEARIARARDICPEYEFVVENVFDSQILEIDDYDFVLVMEFLEHVERDMDVLKRVRKGSTVLGTVPNFPATGHVRHFESVEAVASRYHSVLSEMEITSILSNAQGKTYYVLQGTR